MFSNRLGRFLERAGRRLRKYRQPTLLWIDVGAHLGETTFDHAAANPNLTVYAFEPNLKLAAQRMGELPNFVVLPFAISETDGLSEFHMNSYDQASSLLAFNVEGLSKWAGSDELQIERTITVPTMRLDTFLDRTGIDRVDFLKIDAQGADLSVLKSAGNHLRNIRKIILEVSLTSTPLYEGSHSREECLKFMADAGFALLEEESQSGGQEANLTFISRSKEGRTSAGSPVSAATMVTHESAGSVGGGRPSV